jgi:hypothetical protein
LESIAEKDEFEEKVHIKLMEYIINAPNEHHFKFNVEKREYYLVRDNDDVKVIKFSYINSQIETMYVEKIGSDFYIYSMDDLDSLESFLKELISED